MRTVIVTIEGGVIQDVEVPPGVQVVIHDYDVGNIEEDGVEFDKDGNARLVSIWEQGQMSAPPSETHWYRNHYECERCGHQWTDDWTAMCNDDCPNCGDRHIFPQKSEDIAPPYEK